MKTCNMKGQVNGVSSVCHRSTRLVLCKTKNKNICKFILLVEKQVEQSNNSRFSCGVTAAMLVYRTIVKKVFWNFDSIIMQNVSDILP